MCRLKCFWDATASHKSAEGRYKHYERSLLIVVEQARSSEAVAGTLTIGVSENPRGLSGRVGSTGENWGTSNKVCS